jgi:hypothetical protein
MKNLVVRALAVALAFLSGIGVSRLSSSEAPTVRKSPIVEIYGMLVPPTSLLPATTVNTQAEPLSIFDFDITEFNPNGTYLPIGESPKAFKNFAGIYIETNETNSGELVRYINITTAERDDEIERFTLVTRKQLLFTTQPTVQGIAYRFVGEFLRSGDVSNARRSGVAVLRGKLTKTRNGQRIAESEMSFKIEVFNCKGELVN